VVAGEDVDEGDERNYCDDRPGELRDQAEIAAEHKVDPDQHDRRSQHLLGTPRGVVVGAGFACARTQSGSR
jgi:hypothetical protein